MSTIDFDRKAAMEGVPVLATDPETKEVFVVMKRELYERIRSLFEDVPITEQERLFQIRQFGKRAGWDNPEMDDYDSLDPRTK